MPTLPSRSPLVLPVARLGGELLLGPGECSGAELLDNPAQPLKLCGGEGLLVLGFEKGDPGQFSAETMQFALEVGEMTGQRIGAVFQDVRQL